ncbi:KptA family domain-containing protein [Trichoderma novae-zelandiae]
MSIRHRYKVAEVVSKPVLSLRQFLHRHHGCSLSSLIATHRPPKRQAFSHCESRLAASTLSPLTTRPIKKTPLFSQVGEKMSALEEDGSNAAAHIAVEEKLADGKKQRQRGGRGGGGGGGGQSREVQVSKALSRLLRHQAANAGIQLDAEGFAALDEVMKWGPLRSLKVTFEEIKDVVASNEKQRFTLKLDPSVSVEPSASRDSTAPSHYLIRANQGHSIKIESSAHLEPITLEAGNVPPRVVHGTYFAFWPAIEESGGLKVMGRNHIHCSTGTPEEGAVSGMRKDAELIVEIDVGRSLQEGIQWWRSDNGVLLTEGGEGGVLSTRFFKKVTGRKIDVGVLWEDGERLAGLPEGIKARIPPGKGPGGGGRRGGRGGGRGRGRE